jgi:hypothetical protein
MKRLLYGVVTLGLVAVFAAACTEDPTAGLRGGAARIEATTVATAVLVDDSTQIIVAVLDEQGNAQPLVPTVTSSAPTVVEVVPDPSLTGRPADRTYFFAKALAYGEADIVVTQESATDTIAIATFPAEIDIQGVPATMRSRETANYTLVPLSAGGNAVAGVPGVTVATDSATDANGTLSLDTTALEVQALNAGLALLEAAGPGDAEGSWAIEVIASVPFSMTPAATTFGTVASGNSASVKLAVFDEFSNENIQQDEIDSVTATSTAPGVASAVGAVIDTINDGTGREAWVTATGVAVGAATVSGTVFTTTPSGTLSFPYGPISVSVVAPTITSTALSGLHASSQGITGTGLLTAPFETLVWVDDRPLLNTPTISGTGITATMPTLPAAADYSMVVTVGGVPSNTGTWTQTDELDEESQEPNDGFFIAIGAPFEFSGTFGTVAGHDDIFDLFRFDVSRDVTADFLLSWSRIQDRTKPSDPSHKDLDIWIEDSGGNVVCESYFSDPEEDECDFVAGETYDLWIMDWDAYLGDFSPVEYTITLTPQ